MTITTRVCSRCRERKDRTAFTQSQGKYMQGIGYYCKECRRAHAIDLRARWRAEARARTQHDQS